MWASREQGIPPATTPAGAALYGGTATAQGSAAGSLGIGVQGSGAIGVQGSSASGTGLLGHSGTAAPTGPPATGVFGSSDLDATSIGVRDDSTTGRGGLFKGLSAQVRLVPSSDAAHPVSGRVGDLFVEKGGRLWFCKGQANWKQLA